MPDAVAAAGKTIDEFAAALDVLADVPNNAARDWSLDTLSAMSNGILPARGRDRGGRRAQRFLSLTRSPLR